MNAVCRSATACNHASFHDFIAGKEEIEDADVSQKAVDKKIADALWKEIFDEEYT